MAGICCGVVGETEAAAATAVEPSARAKRRTRRELRPFTFVPSAEMAVPPQPEDANRRKRPMLEPVQIPRDFDDQGTSQETEQPGADADRCESSNTVKAGQEATADNNTDKFGMTSVCGRRRDMEDAVSIHTSFGLNGTSSFFGVFDGHGCSHVAMRCRDRLHEIVQEEIGGCGNGNSVEWKDLMERSFSRMDKDVEEWNGTTAASAAAAGGHDGSKTSSCRCELQTPQCDAVGSTAVVAVLTPDKIVVSNCGDSRGVLCRNGVAIPLSTDHKPDRPDELHRIEAAGGRVIFWDGPRVLGVLAMSRAIGDNYLKPYVIPTPEVIVTERTEDDECLILASDGLWDVVSNETACGVARMCLKAQKPPSPPVSPGSGATVGGGSAASSDKACSDASILLTKLALARHSTDNVSVVVVDLRENRKT